MINLISEKSKIQRGEWVRFVQSHALRGVQVVHNLMKSSEQPLTIVDLPHSELRFKIEVLVSFAPLNSRLYLGVMANDDEDVCFVSSLSNPKDCISACQSSWLGRKLQSGGVVPRGPAIRRRSSVQGVDHQVYYFYFTIFTMIN